jgi:hypothetical protein
VATRLVRLCAKRLFCNDRAASPGHDTWLPIQAPVSGVLDDLPASWRVCVAPRFTHRKSLECRDNPTENIKRQRLCRGTGSTIMVRCQFEMEYADMRIFLSEFSLKDFWLLCVAALLVVAVIG